ncbi:MAG TPA: 30S ribosomal protein S6 [Thermoanaerobaculia bacterium]
MRLYDIVALVTPDLTDEDAQKVAAEYRKILSDGGAEIVKDETWGRRRLAFPILRKREAYYHYFQVSAEPAIIAETERRMKLSDQVLRHLAVRADLELKRAAKSAARQREKAARRPPRPPSPMPPAAPAPVQEATDTGRQFRTEKGDPS